MNRLVNGLNISLCRQPAPHRQDLFLATEAVKVMLQGRMAIMATKWDTSMWTGSATTWMLPSWSLKRASASVGRQSAFNQQRTIWSPRISSHSK